MDVVKKVRIRCMNMTIVVGRNVYIVGLDHTAFVPEAQTNTIVMDIQVSADIAVPVLLELAREALIKNTKNN